MTVSDLVVSCGGRFIGEDSSCEIAHKKITQCQSRGVEMSPCGVLNLLVNVFLTSGIA